MFVTFLKKADFGGGKVRARVVIALYPIYSPRVMWLFLFIVAYLGGWIFCLLFGI